MSTAPIYATILGQLFIQDEKINFLKLLGIIIGFLGIVFLFSHGLLINQSNFLYALIIILGPFCYTLGGLLSLKLKHIKNETLCAKSWRTLGGPDLQLTLCPWQVWSSHGTKDSSHYL